MVKSHVDISTIAHYSGEVEPSKAKTTSNTSEPMHIERPVIEPIHWMEKGSSKCFNYNPNTISAKNYSIIKDLVQSPCAMLALEVLQSFPS